MSSYTIIGLMSGTSMDGLDISNATYTFSDVGRWKHHINQTKTYSYPESLLLKLKNAYNYSTPELLELDRVLGQFFSEKVLDFIETNLLNPKDIDAIASHGHTIYHRPDKGYTLQIGCGETIAFTTGIKVINDFRKKDIVAGGQGAPLVPIGDKLLFSEKAEALLNIGGFANVCFPGEITKAFDICPGNLPMNRIMNALGKEYDENGSLARSGIVDEVILDRLNALEFYHRPAPKSLGVEWLNEHFYPIIDSLDDPANQLSTIVENIALQISNALNSEEVNSVMITGGGVMNEYLLSRIATHFTGELIIPSRQIIEFKEALIFGFLGALYLSGQINTISSVTGANKDVIGGVLHIP